MQQPDTGGPQGSCEAYELGPQALLCLAERMGDPDIALCQVLQNGAPTGVRQPIPASGVWPSSSGKWCDEVAECCDLFWRTSNHVSPEREPAKVRTLLQKELESGSLVRIEGGVSEVHERFPAGSLKLGVVTCAGKDDRLIGDSRASGPAGGPFQ